MGDAKVLTEKELMGARLTQLLKAKGWSASDLARALGGVSPQMVASWVRGDRMPSGKYAPWLPQIFGVDPAALFGNPDSQVSEPTVTNDVQEASTEELEPAGMDPIRTVQVRLAIDLLSSAAKAADKLLDSNLLELAENALWKGIEVAECELVVVDDAAREAEAAEVREAVARLERRAAAGRKKLGGATPVPPKPSDQEQNEG